MSKIQSIFRGFKKYAAVIDGGNLLLQAYSNSSLSACACISRQIQIQKICKIEYFLKRVTTGGRSFLMYVYVITMDDGMQYFFPNSYLKVQELKILLQDLHIVNPNIIYAEEIIDFLQRDFPQKKKIQFDFTVHKDKFFKIDRQISQDYPFWDTFFGFVVVSLFVIIPIIFVRFGNAHLKNIYGPNFPDYKSVFLYLGGISFCVTISNLLAAVSSQYLGNKVTIIAALSFVLFFCLGLV